MISASKCKNCSKFEVISVPLSLNSKKPNCLKKFCKQTMHVHQKLLLNSNPYNLRDFYKLWKVNITKIKQNPGWPISPKKYVLSCSFSQNMIDGITTRYCSQEERLLHTAKIEHSQQGSFKKTLICSLYLFHFILKVNKLLHSDHRFARYLRKRFLFIIPNLYTLKTHYFSCRP